MLSAPDQGSKMVSLSFGLSVVAAVFCVSVNGMTYDETIEMVNKANLGWTAGRNFHPDTPKEYLRRLCGAILTNSSLPRKTYSGLTDIPDEFDARKQWPNCPTISSILDQGSCGSCWAFGTVSAFSDRLCIATNGSFTLPISEEDLTSCGDQSGCNGGQPVAAWNFIAGEGLVTGGGYKSNVGCQTYAFPPCEHHITGRLPPCHKHYLPTPLCKKECNNPAYEIPFAEDKHRADQSTITQFDSIQATQEDLMKHGPITTVFTVYKDFPHYKSGVYVRHPNATFLALHAVRVIGWGVENGTPYWLVANSWNPDWGDKGTFKIRRGTNECDIEDSMVAGLPLLK